MASWGIALGRAAAIIVIVPGRRVRVYGVKTAQCTCAGTHPTYNGWEYYAMVQPRVPIQLPDLTIKN